MPGSYAPLFFGSAVLPDGKVVVQGGEYNCNPSCSGDWQSLGAIYDPVANTWTATTPPAAATNIGDAESVVLPNGTWMLAECCAIAFGDAAFPTYYSFNESTLTFTDLANSTDGKNDDFDEEGWTLLANGEVLTVDAYTSNTVLTGTNSETYNSTTNKWTTAGSTIQQLWDSNCKRVEAATNWGRRYCAQTVPSSTPAPATAKPVTRRFTIQRLESGPQDRISPTKMRRMMRQPRLKLPATSS